MELKESIEHALNGDAILFLGSGSSYGAKNKNDTSLKNGEQLAKYLYSQLKIDTDNNNLFDAVETYQDEINLNGGDAENELIKLLKNEFTVKSIADYHKEIPNVPWKRIYTTNYDNVVEMAYEQSSSSINSAVINTSPVGNKSNTCLHINGYIKALNKNTLNSDFKLTDRSYNTNEFIESLWGNLFKNDIKICRTMIFIGFSCKYDLDIRRVIAKSAVKDKIIFIVSPNEDAINIRYLQKYGAVYNIGIKNFFDELLKIKAKHIPLKEKNINNYYFTNFTEYHNEFPIKKASDNEVLQYYSRGYRTNELYFEKTDNSYYSILKRTCISNIETDIKTEARIIFIHSDIGNGKTEVIEQVKRCVCDTHRIFVLSDNNSELNNEIELLCNSKEKILIIIENYFNYKDVFKQFQIYGDDNITYLFSSRTSIFKTTFENFTDNNISVDQIKIYDINYLDDEECKQLVNIFNEYGYYFKSNENTLNTIKTSCKRRFQNIVLDLFDSNNVAKEFENVLNLIKDQKALNNDKYLFVLFTILIKVMALDIDFYDLLDLYHIPSIKYNFEKDLAVNELLDFKGQNIKIKSSIIAMWLLKQQNLLVDVINALIDIAKKADKYQQVNNKYQRLLGTIISYKHLKFISSLYSQYNKDNLLKIANKLYEEIKNLSYYKDKYFFWLQYAISSLEMGDLQGAEMHFNAAYKKLPNGMTPFEINNHYARLKFEKILNDKYESSQIGQVIDEIEALLTPTMHEEDDEYYCFKMASSYYPKVFHKLYTAIDQSTQSKLIEIVKSYYKRFNNFIKRCRISDFKHATNGFLKKFLILSDYTSQNWIDSTIVHKTNTYLITSFERDGNTENAFIPIKHFDKEQQRFKKGEHVMIILDSFNVKHKKWDVRNISISK